MKNTSITSSEDDTLLVKTICFLQEHSYFNIFTFLMHFSNLNLNLFDKCRSKTSKNSVFDCKSVILDNAQAATQKDDQKLFFSRQIIA